MSIVKRFEFNRIKDFVPSYELLVHVLRKTYLQKLFSEQAIFQIFRILVYLYTPIAFGDIRDCELPQLFSYVHLNSI